MGRCRVVALLARVRGRARDTRHPRARHHVHPLIVGPLGGARSRAPSIYDARLVARAAHGVLMGCWEGHEVVVHILEIHTVQCAPPERARSRSATDSHGLAPAWLATRGRLACAPACPPVDNLAANHIVTVRAQALEQLVGVRLASCGAILGILLVIAVARRPILPCDNVRLDDRPCECNR